jgi:hypothetical protein
MSRDLSILVGVALALGTSERHAMAASRKMARRHAVRLTGKNMEIGHARGILYQILYA